MLSDAVNKYLAIRRALGFKLHRHERLLNNFVFFAAARGERHATAAHSIADFFASGAGLAAIRAMGIHSPRSSGGSQS